MRQEDTLYGDLEEEKRFTSKDAGIYVELTEEVFGKIEDNPVFGDFSRPKQHIFYLAQFHTLAERCSPLPAVEFRHGKLMPADGSVIQKAKIKEYVGKIEKAKSEYSEAIKQVKKDKKEMVRLTNEKNNILNSEMEDEIKRVNGIARRILNR